MQNNLNQLQNFLFQMNNYINKINEIIIQMNTIINQMNCPMINQLNNLMNNNVNNMNNLMNIGNNINFNLNQNCGEENIKEIFNIQFYHCNGTKINIVMDTNKTIGELINIYFKRIGKPEFINNYSHKYYFEFNGCLLNNIEEKKIKDSLFNNINILAKEINEMNPYYKNSI